MSDPRDKANRNFLVILWVKASSEKTSKVKFAAQSYHTGFTPLKHEKDRNTTDGRQSRKKTRAKGLKAKESSTKRLDSGWSLGRGGY